MAGCLSGLVPLTLGALHLAAWLGHASGLAFMRETGLSQLAAFISLYNVLAIGSLVQVFSRLKKIPWVKQVNNPQMKQYLIDSSVFTEKTHRAWSIFFWGYTVAFIPPLATFLLNKGNGHFFILAGVVFAAFSMAVSHHFALKAVETIDKDPFPGNICVNRRLKLALDSHPILKDKVDGELRKRVELLKQISRAREEKKSDD